MTLTELQQLNALREENQRLKRENEILRGRNCALRYAHHQAIKDLSLNLPSPFDVFVVEA